MSLFGALLTGVSGLQAQSQALNVASSNIANVDTVGYKSSDSDFATILASTVGNNDSNAGVVATTSQNISQQGTLQSASATTDLAISGNGFFVTNTTPSATGSLYYTRAGDFTPDNLGNLVNSSGYYLMGYPITTSGGASATSTTLAPVNIANLSGTAEPTTAMSIQANLQSSSAVDSTYAPGDMTNGTATPDFTRTIDVYDSQGGSQPVQLSFIKTGANTWSYEASYTGNSANITGSNPIATGTMSFNSDGTLANANTSASPPTGSISLTIPWSSASGLSSQTISVNMGTVGSANGITQLDSASSLTGSTVNGALFGTMTGVTVGTSGIVTAQYSNGLSQNIYQLPLATFTDPNGLTAVSGTAYQASNASGTASINAADTAGAGTISSSQLEGSTVDIDTEFSNLITTQNAYSAAARIVTTADQMLQTLDQIPSQ